MKVSTEALGNFYMEQRNGSDTLKGMYHTIDFFVDFDLRPKAFKLNRTYLEERKMNSNACFGTIVSVKRKLYQFVLLLSRIVYFEPISRIYHIKHVIH